MSEIFSSIGALINNIVTQVTLLVMDLFGVNSAPITQTGELNKFLAFFKGLVGLIPLLFVAYLIFKLLSSGMQLITKLLSILLLLGVGYLLLNGMFDIDAIVQSGFNW